MKKTLLFLAVALMFGFAAKAQTALSEDFNTCADGTVPSGWVTYGDNKTNHYDGFGDSWEAYQQMMVCITWTEENPPTPVDRWLVTPQVTVPTSNPMVIFDILGVNYGPGTSYAESLKVMVSTTNNQKESFSVLEDLGELPAGNSTHALDLSAYAGQQVYLAFVCYTNDGMYIFLDNVVVKTVPANSIAFVGASTPSYVPMSQTFNFNVTVYNDGSDTLTSFDIAYSLNGDDYTEHVSGMNIAPFTTGTYTLTANYATPGALRIDITVSNPNGEADIDPSDNSGYTTLVIYNPAVTTPRTSLLEHFTTAQCQYCPSGHERLEQAMNGYEDRVCWVAHHVGFGTDAMTINESNQIATLYGGNGTWAPAMMIDRNADNSDGNEADGVIGSVGYASDIQAQFDNALAVPSFITIGLSNLNYDPQSRQLTVTVSGSFVDDFAGYQPRVSLYLTQDGIHARQQSTNGQVLQNYEHNHVIRATISDIWGDAEMFTSTSAGDTYSKTFTYTLPTTFSANNCRLVAFVNDYGPDVLHRTVLNATKSGYLMEGNDPTTGIGDVESSINVVTYPNPATEMVYVTVEGQIRSFEMVDALGRTVMNGENVNADILELNVSSLPQGLYIINVTTDRGVAAQRVNVVK